MNTFQSEALAVSGNASVIVGKRSNGKQSPEYTQEAFIWSASQGMRSVKELLETDYGLALSGWDLIFATGISADGSTVVGFGINPDGQTEGWVATVPEPGTFTLLAIGGALVGMRCRRSSGRTGP
jgi:uncharacterized membrane protein